MHTKYKTILLKVNIAQSVNCLVIYFLFTLCVRFGVICGLRFSLMFNLWIVTHDIHCLWHRLGWCVHC